MVLQAHTETKREASLFVLQRPSFDPNWWKEFPKSSFPKSLWEKIKELEIEI